MLKSDIILRAITLCEPFSLLDVYLYLQSCCVNLSKVSLG